MDLIHSKKCNHLNIIYCIKYSTVQTTDVLKALALGAKMVFIGRPVLWGLAFDVKTGVDLTLEILRKDTNSFFFKFLP